MTFGNNRCPEEFPAMSEKADKHGWRTANSKQVYQNSWISVREDQVIYPNGQPGIYGVVEKGPGVAIIALDNEKNIYLVKQYRYTLDDVFWELPAGAIHPGETETQSAQRELFEEIGLRPGRFDRLGNFYTALGHETAEIIAYLAQDLDTKGHSLDNQQHDESILEIIRLPIGQVKQMIGRGEIKCGISLAALSLLFVKYPEL
jgi:8-oxo-dGTP pyrophosphatase MutT (NUDIX family)